MGLSKTWTGLNSFYGGSISGQMEKIFIHSYEHNRAKQTDYMGRIKHGRS